jgi:pyruvate dehydrogenase E2 component (dihydrolipoamide acetyltransferase)
MAKSEINNDWRKVAAAIFKKPSDSKVFGIAELDVTALEEFVTKKLKEGLKITLTHIFTLIISRGIKEEVPEINCYVRRGNIKERDQIDAMVSVLIGDGELSSVKVGNTDQLNLIQVADVLSKGIKNSRSGDENKTMKMKAVMGKIPWPFRTWIFNFVKLLTIRWGISIPSAGLTTKSFGSFVLTNIGSIGIDNGLPALFPISNVAFVFVMGGSLKETSGN